MAMVPIVFSDMASSRFGKHGRHDQRQASEQDQYQHHFAEHLVVDLSVELEAAPEADEQERQTEPVQFYGFHREGAGDGHGNRDHHKGSEQYRLKHRPLLIPFPAAPLAGDGRDDATEASQSTDQAVDEP